MIAGMNAIKTCRRFRLRSIQVAALAVAVVVAIAVLVEFAAWLSGP